MEQQVSDEVQAAMSLKLMENVRELIREEIRAALEDFDFMSRTRGYEITNTVMRHMNWGDYNFKQAVRQVVAEQMHKV
jgi:hypothetical protein